MTTSTPRIVELELTPARFHCPRTGQQIVGPDGPFRASPATAFCYVFEGSDFEYIDPKLEGTWSEVLDSDASPDENEDEDKDLYDLFLERLQLDGLVIFRITEHGMACGPVSITADIAIDFAVDLEDGETST